MIVMRMLNVSTLSEALNVFANLDTLVMEELVKVTLSSTCVSNSDSQDNIALYVMNACNYYTTVI